MSRRNGTTSPAPGAGSESAGGGYHGRAGAPAAGAERFAPVTVAPARSPGRAVAAAVALLLLVGGLPVALWTASGPPPVPTSWPDWHTLVRTMGAQQLVEVLVAVVWLLWAQFVVCTMVEVVAAVRGGVLARSIPLAGPSQRLARALVAAVLLTAAMATQASAAVAPAPAPAIAAAQFVPGNGAAPGELTAVVNRAGVGGGPASAYVSAGQPSDHVPGGGAASARASAAPDRSASAATAPGQVIPADAGAELVGRRVYVVQPPQGRHHESLWEIAARHLGDGRRYSEIYALNDGRTQPDGRTLHLARLIQPGWLLVMPDDAVGVERYLPPAPAGSGIVDPGPSAASGERPSAQDGVTGHSQHPDQAPSIAGREHAVGEGFAAPQVSAPQVSAPQVSQVSGMPISATLMAELGGGGLLGAGLLGVLLMARRRRRGVDPAPAASEAEVWLRVGADPVRASWLNRALRSLPAACREAGVPLPHVYAAVLDDAALELMVSPHATQAAAGWTAVADGARWRLECSAPLPEPGDDCPYPALVSLGRDVAGRDILLQLGASAGPIAVTGSPAMVSAVIRALAVELATNSWAHPLRVTVTDLPTITGAVAGARLGQTTVAEALDRLDVDLLTGRDGPDRGRQRAFRDGVVSGGRPLPGGVPQHLVLGRAPDADTRARLRGLAAAGVGLLVAGEVDGYAWRLQVDDAGTLTLPELGIVVTASRLGEESVQRLADLLAAAARPDAGDPGIHHGGGDPRAGGRPRVPAPATAADDAAWAVAPARVGVLGPVLVRAEGRVDGARADQLAELVAFLALHPGGVHPTVLASAIWPRGVTGDVRDATIARARDWLGTDELGGHRLRADPDGRLTLAPGVVADWDVLCTLVGRSRLAPDTRAEADLLARALRLVRGPLAGGIEAGRYAWLARTGLHRTMPDLVTDAAHRLAELLDDDPHAATEAAHRGLLVDPCDQRLWRDILRSQFALWGADGVRNTAAEMTGMLANLGVEPDGPTQALLADLLPGIAGPGAPRPGVTEAG
jgi:hypothetical protein